MGRPLPPNVFFRVLMTDDPHVARATLAVHPSAPHVIWAATHPTKPLATVDEAWAELLHEIAHLQRRHPQILLGLASLGVCCILARAFSFWFTWRVGALGFSVGLGILLALTPAVARRQDLAADAAVIPFGSLPVQTLLARWARFADEGPDATHFSYRVRARHLAQQAGCPTPA